MSELLPNSLGRVPKQDMNLSFPGRWFYMFCANCGIECGRVMDTYLPDQYAFVLCNPCAEKYGEVAGCTATPFDVFFKKVEEAMKEEYGHSLNEIEMAKELDDPSSIISKLEKEGLGGT